MTQDRSPDDTAEETPPGEVSEEHADAEAVRLGRFLPLGMLGGLSAGALAGALLHKPGIFIPVGVALGILLAGTLPVFLRRRRE